MSPIHLRHLGESGLQIDHGDASIALEPPRPLPLPTLITWSEAERVTGPRGPRPWPPRPSCWPGWANRASPCAKGPSRFSAASGCG